nr:hypothetical protein CFP56_14533 [Quercus suber]
MVKKLKEIWQWLTVTEEEDDGITLGRDSAKIAKELGKNCVIMKILTQRCINIEALKKNTRMLWKPNKGMQISEIEDNLFLVEFGDSRDKKKIMEMRPWSYEKQLILLQDFEREMIPKDITMKWSPFWVQIYNLPLKSITREAGQLDR